MKINCKDPRKITTQRVLELKNHIYLITYQVECFEQVTEKKDSDDGGGGDEYLDDDLLSDYPDDGGNRENNKPALRSLRTRRQKCSRQKQEGSNKNHYVNRVLQWLEGGGNEPTRGIEGEEIPK